MDGDKLYCDKGDSYESEILGRGSSYDKYNSNCTRSATTSYSDHIYYAADIDERGCKYLSGISHVSKNYVRTGFGRGYHYRQFDISTSIVEAGFNASGEIDYYTGINANYKNRYLGHKSIAQGSSATLTSGAYYIDTVEYSQASGIYGVITASFDDSEIQAETKEMFFMQPNSNYNTVTEDSNFYIKTTEEG